MLASTFQQRKNIRKKQELSPEQLEELREVFRIFDLNQSNCIYAKEFKAILRALGFDCKKEHVVAIMLESGKDINDSINFEEFCQMMVGRMPDRSSKEEIHKLFCLFDEEGSGKITFRSLKKIILEIGETLSDDDILEMIEEADRDGDGGVSFEDFYRVMRYRTDPLEDSDSADFNQ